MKIKHQVIWMFFWLVAFPVMAQTPESPIHVYDSMEDTSLSAPLEKWRAEGHYSKLLSDSGIKSFDCNGGCEGVRIDLVFYVDEITGYLVPKKINESIVCGKKASQKFKDRFYRSVTKIRFPDQYKGRYFQYQFGAILKC